MKYTVELAGKKEVAAGTMAFYFSKPAGFVFKAGQHADWNLINPPETDAEGNGRCFTLASAPYEDLLMVATRMRETAFKRALGKMEIGSKVEMDGPRGMLTLPIDARAPVVFLAGGIGITPFRSMVLEANHENDPRRIFLFYANRHPQDGPFFDELQKIAETDSNFSFIPTITRPAEVPDWKGETGHINKEMIGKYAGDMKKPVYYLAGPTEMTNALNEMLIEAGISPDNIKVEDFPGY